MLTLWCRSAGTLVKHAYQLTGLHLPTHEPCLLYGGRGAGTPVNNGSLQCDHKLGLPLYDGPGAGYTCKK